MPLRIAQVRIYPEKETLGANHERLMAVLGQVSQYRPDVVVTPECYLDGYVVTEEWVHAESLLRYAIDPQNSLHVADVYAL